MLDLLHCSISYEISIDLSVPLNLLQIYSNDFKTRRNDTKEVVISYMAESDVI